mmetsp:Transcript_6299/g.15610  ORF Transcript_6299/g.15610 Transcript_6299/m.15610 type:complete len:230 (-) Transcript_6299:1823-2512(-)
MTIPSPYTCDRDGFTYWSSYHTAFFTRCILTRRGAAAISTDRQFTEPSLLHITIHIAINCILSVAILSNQYFSPMELSRKNLSTELFIDLRIIPHHGTNIPPNSFVRFKSGWTRYLRAATIDVVSNMRRYGVVATIAGLVTQNCTIVLARFVIVRMVVIFLSVKRWHRKTTDSFQVSGLFIIFKLLFQGQRGRSSTRYIDNFLSEFRSNFCWSVIFNANQGCIDTSRRI